MQRGYIIPWCAKMLSLIINQLSCQYEANSGQYGLYKEMCQDQMSQKVQRLD